MHFTYELSRSLNMAILSENLATFNARVLCPGYNINAFNILLFHTIIIWNYDGITVATRRIYLQDALIYMIMRLSFNNAGLKPRSCVRIPVCVCEHCCLLY